MTLTGPGRAAPPAGRRRGEPAAPKPPAVKTSGPEIGRAIHLLRRNQPAQALEILQKLETLFPRNPELLALCGAAAYKSDNTRLALGYWKQSLDLKADPVVERTYQAVLHESQNDKSSEKNFGTRFLLRYDGAASGSGTPHAMVA